VFFFPVYNVGCRHLDSTCFPFVRVKVNMLAEFGVSSPKKEVITALL